MSNPSLPRKNRHAAWKLAVAGGALLGVGAATNVAQASAATHELDERPATVPAPRADLLGSLRSPSTTTVTVGETTTPTVAPVTHHVDSTPSTPSAPSVQSVKSVKSAQSVQSVQSVRSAQSVPSVQSVASP